jgi:hypothetical protein
VVGNAACNVASAGLGKRRFTDEDVQGGVHPATGGVNPPYGDVIRVWTCTAAEAASAVRS